ncbi:glycosyltransferase [Prosthecochloris sp.]|uniref:glycosyltransferase n=1 Tax=Prosthecochloris sp. TaxID=290513 RepID=UPI00257C89B4|nr:glycosyltransferase [Prosthecochloris sp.]
MAKACRNEFNIVFATHGGQFEELIENEGFPLTHLEPELTDEQIEHLYQVDQGEKIGSFFTVKQTRQRVEKEAAFLRNERPLAAVTGFNVTITLSSRAADVPLIWLTQSTWDIQAMIDEGLGAYADDLDMAGLRLLPDAVLKWLTRQTFSWLGGTILRPLNTVAKEYGIEKLYDLRDLWQGDHNLLAEPPDFSGLSSVPDTYYYIGPLIADLASPVPEEINRLAAKQEPLVYFSMGSSGKPQVIKSILEGFRDQPFNVVSPMKTKLQELDVKVPPNVLLTDWLPALDVSRLAGISVIHGGIGTVMTAALAGKPVLGIGMMYEQEYNIDCLVRKGFAHRIRRTRLDSESVNKAILELLTDSNAKTSAMHYADHLKESLGSRNQKIRDFFHALEKGELKPRHDLP